MLDLLNSFCLCLRGRKTRLKEVLTTGGFLFLSPTAILESVPNYHYPKQKHLSWGTVWHEPGGFWERKEPHPRRFLEKFSLGWAGGAVSPSRAEHPSVTPRFGPQGVQESIPQSHPRLGPQGVPSLPRASLSHTRGLGVPSLPLHGPSHSVCFKSPQPLIIVSAAIWTLPNSSPSVPENLNPI